MSDQTTKETTGSDYGETVRYSEEGVQAVAGDGRTHNSTGKRIVATRADSANRIDLGGRRYLKPEQLAEILQISVRTLSRWDAARTGPPRIRVGKMVLYDAEKIPVWLERFETKPVSVTGHRDAVHCGR